MTGVLLSPDGVRVVTLSGAVPSHLHYTDRRRGVDAHYRLLHTDGFAAYYEKERV